MEQNQIKLPKNLNDMMGQITSITAHMNSAYLALGDMYNEVQQKLTELESKDKPEMIQPNE